MKIKPATEPNKDETTRILGFARSILGSKKITNIKYINEIKHTARILRSLTPGIII